MKRAPICAAVLGRLVRDEPWHRDLDEAMYGPPIEYRWVADTGRRKVR